MSTPITSPLDAIHDIAQQSLAGEERNPQQLHQAVSVCDWITGYHGEEDTWGRVSGDIDNGNFTNVAAFNEKETAGFYVAKWENDRMVKAITVDGASAEELADIGRSFLQAAIHKHRMDASTADRA